MNRLKVEKMCFTAFLAVVVGLASVTAQQMPSKADKQFEMGMYEEAALAYKTMIERGEDASLKVYDRLAVCYTSVNKPFDAIETYEEAAMKYDMSSDSYLNWAAALKKIGRNEEANEIISFASIKGNLSFDEIAIADQSLYSVEPVVFNSTGNEFAPAFLGHDIVCVTDNYNTLKVTGVSTKINELPHLLMRVNHQTGQRERLRGKLKDYINDGPTSYSKDGSVVCFSKGHFPAAQSPKIGNKKSGSIYIAEADARGDWDVVISLPSNELGVANIYPHLTADGQRVYFASNREGGLGGFDIYYTERIADGWTSPKNMGDKINTVGDEISPSLDNEMLYFASNSKSGFGGYDIYSINQKSMKGAVNLGAAVNSTWDDYALITKSNGSSGYFTSNRPGKGGEDIYKFTRISNASISMPVAQPNTATVSIPAASAKPTAETKEIKTPEIQNLNVNLTAFAKPNSTSTTTQDASIRHFESDNIPTFNIANSTTGADRIKTIFTIQVAALSKVNASYKNIAKNLQDLGLVYKVFFHNVIKIRVGQYDREDEARKMLEKVKSRGYNDAFVVKEQLIREEVKSYEKTEYKPATEPATEPITKDASSSSQDAKYQEALKNVTRYRIKLGSYTDMAAFDDTKVKRYGTVFKDEQGDWTKVYLGDYITIEDAEAVRTEVSKQGFAAAIIYGLQDDKLIKIK